MCWVRERGRESCKDKFIVEIAKHIYMNEKQTCLQSGKRKTIKKLLFEAFSTLSSRSTMVSMETDSHSASAATFSLCHSPISIDDEFWRYLDFVAATTIRWKKD